MLHNETTSVMSPTTRAGSLLPTVDLATPNDSDQVAATSCLHTVVNRETSSADHLQKMVSLCDATPTVDDTIEDEISLSNEGCTRELEAYSGRQVAETSPMVAMMDMSANLQLELTQKTLAADGELIKPFIQS